MTAPPEGGDERGFPGWVIGVAVGALALVLGYFALGMPGMDHSAPATLTTAPDAARDFVTLSVADFANEVASADAFVVNVHVPYAGEILGTDEHIPYDRIALSPLLPDDRNTRILLYCRTGSMSAEAAAALADAGYRSVAHLDGGMEAWAREGRPLRGAG